MRRPKRRPRKRTFKAARMVLAGKTVKEVAKELGVTPQAVNLSVRTVLDYTEFEDIQKCRALVNHRIDAYRKPLLEIAGVPDIDNGKSEVDKKKIGDDHVRVSAVRALNELEKRRCDMFGWDAPKMIVTPPPPAGSLQDASLEEIADECKRLNIPLPPGVRDELAKRIGGAQAGDRTPPADPRPAGK